MKKAIIFLTSIIMALFLTACSLTDYRGNTEVKNSGFNIIKTEVTPAFNLTSKDETEGLLAATQAAAKALPSVVGILNYNDAASVDHSSEGSGIVMTADGYIITNAHVIEGAQLVKVVCNDNSVYYAETGNFWYDTYTDLGLIKLKLDEGISLTPAEFGNANELMVAEDLLAIGNPGGLVFRSSVTKGIVSSLNRPYEAIPGSGYIINCIQTDAAINPGNSGGALINMHGQVIGINSAKIADVNFEGIGFAITINEALPILSELKANGYVSGRAAIGITYQFVSVNIKDGILVKNINGLYVTKINNTELTAKGLKQYDVIALIDGEAITSPGMVSAVLKNKSPGDTLNITFYRLGLRSYNYYNVTKFNTDITLIEATNIN